jgi:hypothetical protein
MKNIREDNQKERKKKERKILSEEESVYFSLLSVAIITK